MEDQKDQVYKGIDRRTESRTPVDEYSSVEFSISDLPYRYQFKIVDVSPSGMSILVKEGSAVLEHLKVGDVLDMKYYHVNRSKAPESLKTEIKHVTRDDEGRFRGHYFIGLSILGR
jgi:hypothetical protein